MKKLLCAITIAATMLSGCTNNSTKDNERKLEVIKRLYSKEAICFSPGEEEFYPICKEFAKSDKFTGYKPYYDEKTKTYSEHTLEGNATPDLRKFFDADNACGKKYETICAIDYNVVFQGQDFEYEKILNTIKYEVVPNGNVKVDFYNFEPITQYYVMQCNNEKCLIDDILEADWEETKAGWKRTNKSFTSFKERLKNREELAEFLK